MVSTRKTLLTALLALAVALSGCSDDGGETPEPTDSATETANPTATVTTQPEPMAPAPFYINGTVTGVIDCTLLSNGAPAQGGSNQALPADGANATYELTISNNPNPVGNICMVFDSGETGNSGTVPAAATSFTVYADTAAQPIAFSMRLDLVA